MRRITSFKPQHRQHAARSATPPPPPYEPLSPLLPPAAANPASASRDDAAAHPRPPNGAHAHAAAGPVSSRAGAQHSALPATRDRPPQHAAPLPPLPPLPPQPLPHRSWPPGSPIEALADAAVASQHTSPPYVDHPRRASCAAASPNTLPNTLPRPPGERPPAHLYPRDAAYTFDDRPAKRARSELYSASSPTYGHQQHSRPATSHNPGWSYNVEHMVDTGMRMYQEYQDPANAAPKQEHNPDKRLSDAQLLLDFFQVSAHTAQTPPSTAKRLSVSQVAPAYPAQYPPLPSPHYAQQQPLPVPGSPRALTSQQTATHAQQTRPSSDVAHVPEPPSLPIHATLSAPAVQTRTPPEDHSAAQPPPPMSNTATAEDAKPKKHQGWPKGKPRGPRNTPSSSKRKKATPKPRAASSAIPKSAVDQGQPPLSNGVAVATDASTSSSSNITPPYDQPSGPRRHSFSNSFLALPTTDTISAALRAQSVPLQTLPGTAPSAAEPSRRTKAQQVAEPELICASCKSSDSEVKVGDGEQWIGCDGCKEWYHYACAGFNSEREVRDVNKFYCEPCRPKFGQTTSRSTGALSMSKSDLTQRFANLSERTLPLTTPASIKVS